MNLIIAHCRKNVFIWFQWFRERRLPSDKLTLFDMISITWLVLKLLSVSGKTAEFLLCHFSLRTIILVAQQIGTVQWKVILFWIISLLPVSHFLPNHVLWNVWMFSNVAILMPDDILVYHFFMSYHRIYWQFNFHSDKTYSQR